MIKEIIALVNQKGGVGKTTTACNIATSLAALGNKILLIDADPQGNASTGFGLYSHERKISLYDLISGKSPFKDVIISTKVKNVDMIVSTVELAAAEIELVNHHNPQFVFKEFLSEHFKNYNYVIIDCPPSLGYLTLNALTCATSILIPLQCEFYALEGLKHLLETYKRVRNNLNTSLDLKGVVLTMYDKRNNLSSLIEEDVRNCLGDKVFHTVIPRNVRISEAPSHGMPVLLYDYNCSGSQAYISLVKEILDRSMVNV